MKLENWADTKGSVSVELEFILSQRQTLKIGKSHAISVHFPINVCIIL